MVLKRNYNPHKWILNNRSCCIMRRRFLPCNCLGPSYNDLDTIYTEDGMRKVIIIGDLDRTVTNAIGKTLSI